MRIHCVRLKTSMKMLVRVLAARRFSTKTGGGERIQPVMMAYNSYESTGAEDGVQPPLIILHGLFGSKTNYTSACKAYQRALNCRVYAVDARNHGDSPHAAEHGYRHLAADLEHFMDALGVRRARIMGHSMGGRTAMLFALTRPHRVDRLVVLDVSPLSHPATALQAMPPLFTLMARATLPRGGTLAEARRHLDRQLAPRVRDRALRTFLLTNVVQRADGVHAWRLNLPVLHAHFATDIARFPPLPADAIFSGPTLFLGGGKSDYLPRDSLPKLRRIFPAAELQHIEDASHWLHADKPHDFLRITSAFLVRDFSDAQSSHSAPSRDRNL